MEFTCEIVEKVHEFLPSEQKYIIDKDIIIVIWYLVKRVPFNPKMAFSLLRVGVPAGIILGFPTYLPFFV